MTTTILSPGTPNTDEAGWTAYSLRVVLPALTGDSLGQLLVTIVGPGVGTNASYADHVGIGISNGTLGDTGAKLAEVTFSSNQSHGYSMVSNDPGSVALVSDPINFSAGDGAIAGAKPVLIFDFTAAPPSGVFATNLSGVSGANSYYVNAAATYNQTAPAGQTANTANTLYLCSLIQTQAGGGGIVQVKAPPLVIFALPFAAV